MQRLLLILNAGSSSLKVSIYSAAQPEEKLLFGKLDRLNSTQPELRLERGSTSLHDERLPGASMEMGIQCLFSAIEKIIPSFPSRLVAVGHRLVHGGDQYVASQPVTPTLLEDLQDLVPFAPEHLPLELRLIDLLQKMFPKLPQVACFDTAFHRDLPMVARRFPLPRRFYEKGIRRYGFHGLSFEYLLDTLDSTKPGKCKKVILAHLGNGCSLAAVLDGKCIDTSMGFTPAGGLMMGRRSGDLDPGLCSYLLRHEKMTPAEFDQLINDESGLLGVSGISSDIRELLRLEAESPAVSEAIQLFCYTVRKWIGSFSAALNGVDTLVFSGGIGENNPGIRARICQELSYLGLSLDPDRNQENAAIISKVSSAVAVQVIPTNEEVIISRSVAKILNQKAS